MRFSFLADDVSYFAVRLTWYVFPHLDVSPRLIITYLARRSNYSVQPHSATAQLSSSKTTTARVRICNRLPIAVELDTCLSITITFAFAFTLVCACTKHHALTSKHRPVCVQIDTYRKLMYLRLLCLFIRLKRIYLNKSFYIYPFHTLIHIKHSFYHFTASSITCHLIKTKI